MLLSPLELVQLPFPFQELIQNPRSTSRDSFLMSSPLQCLLECVLSLVSESSVFSHSSGKANREFGANFSACQLWVLAISSFSVFPPMEL